MQLRGKSVLVLGTKRSGMGAIELLVREGARVRAMDADLPAPEQKARLDELGIPLVTQAEENVPDAGALPFAIVLSPAVPFDLPMLTRARKNGAHVIGEIELASYFLKGPVIGITGSNGKTTTTALTGHILSECGMKCQVGGNIGKAVTAMVDTSSEDQWNVLELSSFQLESIQAFRANIGACLNVTPDHLDRHHTVEAYTAAKRRVFENQRSGDSAILNYDDPACRRFSEGVKGKVLWFSSSERPPVGGSVGAPTGAWLRGDDIMLGDDKLLDRSEIQLRGLHNVENIMAAALMAHEAGAAFDAIASAVRSFPGVEHRIEFVRELRGVSYFNDSKATNVDAALKAIDSFPGPLWIILGGKDKGASYEPLMDPLRRKSKGALLIGAEPPYPYAAAPLITKALTGVLPLVQCGTMNAAVRYASEHARQGDIVLLAPACASFDQFQNYEQRGNAFKHLVQELL